MSDFDLHRATDFEYFVDFCFFSWMSGQMHTRTSCYNCVVTNKCQYTYKINPKGLTNSENYTGT